MTTNRDKYVDEIREIRRRHVEETKNVQPEERAGKVRKESEEFQKLVEKKLAEKASTK